MKGKVNFIVASVFLGVSLDGLASQDFLKGRNCQTCHSEEKRLIGPAYKNIAAKYRNDNDAESKIAEKIRKGSSGTWGIVPMPANTEINDSEARKLASLILLSR